MGIRLEEGRYLASVSWIRRGATCGAWTTWFALGLPRLSAATVSVQRQAGQLSCLNCGDWEGNAPHQGGACNSSTRRSIKMSVEATGLLSVTRLLGPAGLLCRPTLQHIPVPQSGHQRQCARWMRERLQRLLAEGRRSTCPEPLTLDLDMSIVSPTQVTVFQDFHTVDDLETVIWEAFWVDASTTISVSRSSLLRLPGLRSSHVAEGRPRD